MNLEKLAHSISPHASKWQIAVWVTLSAAMYVAITWFTPREWFFQFLGLFICLSAGYLWMIPKRQNPQLILILGIFFRLIVFFALPNLSDDFYRFIWDGRLLSHGVNPFAQLPSEYMLNPDQALRLGLNTELYQGLNSPNYFTIYPPVLQGVFYLSSVLFPKSVLEAVWLMKLFVFLAEIGSMVLIAKLLRHFNYKSHLLGVYAFNPLVIIELTGNLHFEALMIFFLLWAVWLIVKKQWWWSVFPFALAVGSKLLPLIVLPLFLKRFGWQNTFLYGLIIILLLALMFIPVFDLNTFIHLGESIGLYFQKFEFNASIYYLIRWAGYQFTGYNIIYTSGKVLVLLTLVGIFVWAFREKEPDDKKLPTGIIWVFFIYFALASIVHPWYITILIAFCVFTPYRWPIVWTLVIPLSYYTYRTDAYTENLWLVAVEYLIVGGWILYELFVKKPFSIFGSK